MRWAIATILALSPLWAADKYVCDTPQFGHSCDYTNSQLQTALSAMTCNNRLVLQSGHTYTGSFSYPGGTCTSGTPITVTSSAFVAGWGPDANTRITPNDQPLTASLANPGLNEMTLYGLFDGSRNPPNSWHFVGLSFTMGSLGGGYSATGAVVGTAGAFYPSDTDTDRIQNSSEIPNDIIFDRDLFLGQIDNSVEIQTFLRLNAKSSVIKNCFFRDMWAASFEGHAVGVATSTGSLTIQNNYMDALGIPFFVGGVTPDYFGGNPSNITFQYNYLTKQYKWWPAYVDNSNNVCFTPGVGTCHATINPFPQYFISGGNKSGCSKNLLEFKSMNGAEIHNNVLELAWQDHFCEGQYYGITVTPRLIRPNSTDGDFPGNQLGRLTTVGTAFSWDGTLNQDANHHDPDHTMQAGQGICAVLSTSPLTRECHTIVSANMGTKSGVLDLAFAADQTNNTNWSWIVDPNPTVSGYNFTENVFRNVATPFQHLGIEPGLTTDASNVGRMATVTIEDNLVVNTVGAGGDGSPVWHFAFSDWPNVTNLTTTGGKSYTFDHNTISIPGYTPHTVFQASCEDSNGTYLTTCQKTDGFVISNNLFPAATLQPDTNRYSVVASGGSGCSQSDFGCIGGSFAKGTRSLNNNLIPFMTCSQAWCSANITSGAPTFVPGTYQLTSGSVGHNASDTGTDLGADWTKMPVIRNLTVSSGVNTATLSFSLPSAISAAGSTQPCTLEVSTSENLRSDLGTYTLTNDLNPNFFKQATASNRSNSALPAVTVSGGSVTWPIGANSTTTGDDSNSHDLRLTPNTSYFGRVMCYGDTALFTFNTSAIQNVRLSNVVVK